MSTSAPIQGTREGGRRVDLSGHNLSNVNLARIDLRGANLRGVNMQGNDLMWQDLQGADLRGANLQRANLQWVDLRGVNLQDTNLLWADLRAADLRGADLRGTSVLCTDLRSAYWDGLTIDHLPSGRICLIPTPDGWYMQTGCWEGTPDDLRHLIAQDEGWPEAEGGEIARRRPYLEAALTLCEVHMADHADVIDDLRETWGSTDEEAA